MSMPRVPPPNGLMGFRRSYPPSAVHATGVHSSTRDLFDKLDIRVELRGLLGSEHCRTVDVYSPEARRSTPTKRTVSHLDVVSCWKGLSDTQASEILYWEKSFGDCLERIVTDIFVALFADHLRDENELIDDVPTLDTALRMFVRAKSERLLDIPIDHLVNGMIHGFYNERSEHAGPGTWFLSTGNLSAMVFNFVRTRDCFLEGILLPSMRVRISCEPSCVGLVIADVDWQAPNIDFFNLPAKLPVGADYWICPSYKANCLSDGFETFQTESQYEARSSLGSREFPNHWDDLRRCFSVLVPPPGEASRELLLYLIGKNSKVHIETKLSATIRIRFPGGVRFEQISRYRIHLELAHPSTHCEQQHISDYDESPWLPSYTHTPLSKHGTQGSLELLAISSDECESVTPDSPPSDFNSQAQLRYDVADTVKIPKSELILDGDVDTDDVALHSKVLSVGTHLRKQTPAWSRFFATETGNSRFGRLLNINSASNTQEKGRKRRASSEEGEATTTWCSTRNAPKTFPSINNFEQLTVGAKRPRIISRSAPKTIMVESTLAAERPRRTLSKLHRGFEVTTGAHASPIDKLSPSVPNGTLSLRGRDSSSSAETPMRKRFDSPMDSPTSEESLVEEDIAQLDGANERFVFKEQTFRTSKHRCPPAGSPEAKMREYQDNYAAFLERKMHAQQAKNSLMGDEELEQAFLFSDGSEGST